MSAQQREEMIRKLHSSVKADPACAGREFLDDLMKAQGVTSERFWVDTSPPNAVCADRIFQVATDALFVHMVRDGRDTAASVMAEPWGPSTPQAAISWWEGRMRRAHHPTVYQRDTVRMHRTIADPADRSVEMHLDPPQQRSRTDIDRLLPDADSLHRSRRQIGIGALPFGIGLARGDEQHPCPALARLDMIDLDRHQFGTPAGGVIGDPQERRIAHAQLTFGNSMIMLGSALDDEFGRLQKTPAAVGGIETQSPYVIVPDADAHYAQARAKGAEIVYEISDQDYGGRGYSCRDPQGHLWHFGTYDPWADAS